MQILTEMDEAELKIMVKQMYKAGGQSNVLSCIRTLEKCIEIIGLTLGEIQQNEKHI